MHGGIVGPPRERCPLASGAVYIISYSADILIAGARRECRWLCDHGFHRVAWLEKLAEFEQAFVVRLTRDATVRLAERACYSGV